MTTGRINQVAFRYRIATAGVAARVPPLHAATMIVRENFLSKRQRACPAAVENVFLNPMGQVTVKEPRKTDRVCLRRSKAATT